MARRIRRILVAIVALVIVAAAGLAAWTILNPNRDSPDREMGTVAIDFKTIKLSARGNKYLVLPPGFKGGDTADAESPVFALLPEALAKRARDLLVGQERAELVRDIDASHQFELVQRSAVFRFPDFVAIQAVPVGEGRSALAIYSRSKYGRSDFGVNRKRIQAWLALLKKELPGG